ncbi:putative leucine-rich repeat receptor-like serine/threonine-protein kinase [Cinnamomum micranthum f. kanehirae]|uniref:non-specific serine/threonine protein kinase n=1 Tax=Cinnamomum micranthum f. kanehirae TaxID=337451 RepID=A0A3S3NJB2_9MAGN|nr:putative leucine-rich repeat receptor-like serine/threonine-protein kinase [Cinnamomum micranthum f. kanehirae]
MQMQRQDVVFLFLLTFSCFPAFGSGAIGLPQAELDALARIGDKVGKPWNYGANPCTAGPGSKDIDEFENYVNCTYPPNDTFCHVESITFRYQNLQGMLPPELAKLPYLQRIDLARNYLNGTIPAEWGSIRLVNIIISSNAFLGQLPTSLANLTNLIDFRISDNSFTGRIPDFIKNWTKLEILAIQGSGLQGPIPSGISSLVKLIDLRISDINGTASPFPELDKMTSIKTLILRNCNLTGSIPPYIWTMKNLKTLDLSFNMLEGQLPRTFSKPKAATFIYLTSNLLNGSVPEGLRKVSNVDLSYNNFTPASTKDCQDVNVNLFGSPPTANNLSGAVPRCLKDFDCPKSLLSKFYINCGGGEVNASVIGTHRIATFTEDHDSGGASRYVQSGEHWAFSSTGNFLDNNQEPDVYIGKNISRLIMPNSQLYMTARLSPLSLTYYGLCLWNGNYTVKLHFAEIMFSDDESYSSLGKRIFDIYIQGKLVWKDFNIVAEAGGTHKAVVRNFTANVTTNTLEIRFYWAGKGTQSLPNRGTYGPLISAISVESVTCCGKSSSVQHKLHTFLFAPIVKTNNQYAEIGSLPFENRQFTYAEVLSMTNNFQRCIGKGGFGTVYHGQMTDGTHVAVKMLSPGSIKSPCQGSKEFQNEAHLLMRVHHRNLVPFIGYCQEDGNMALIYNYMAQGHLGTHLSDSNSDALSWDRRLRIALDVAQGLEYLHNGCKPPIIHRDVKTANILLNERLEAKIGDFGLSKVFSDDLTHVSTAVKGTFGYLDPEYCNSNNLTEKSDVYSFGVVLLQLITGKKAIVRISGSAPRSLIDWAIPMVVGGDIMDLIDPKLEGNYDIKSIQKVVEIARACTSPKSIDRPHMRDVVVELKEYIGNEKAFESESAPENGGCSGPVLTTSEILSCLSAR